jgi:hypothetical protein
MEAINNLVAFKAISNFIRDLSEVFVEKNRSIALYNRLIEKTTIAHEKPIAKHVDCFTSFCITNREAITEKSYDKFVSLVINYSEKVSLNFKEIFDESDSETKEAIWNHLLAISAVVDPASNAKKILKESMVRHVSSKTGEGNEEEFLTSLIEKVEKNFTPESMQNPMQAIGSILSSGVFNDMVGTMQKGINDGSLDLGRLMGTMQTVMGGMNMGGAGGGSGGLPFDISSLSGLLGGLMPQPPKQ